MRDVPRKPTMPTCPFSRDRPPAALHHKTAARHPSSQLERAKRNRKNNKRGMQKSKGIRDAERRWGAARLTQKPPESPRERSAVTKGEKETLFWLDHRGRRIKKIVKWTLERERETLEKRPVGHGRKEVAYAKEKRMKYRQKQPTRESQRRRRERRSGRVGNISSAGQNAAKLQ